MVVRPYAVLTLPAKGTVLGALSERGCRVELVAAPRQDDALGRCYVVEFGVEGIAPDQAVEAEQRLRQVSACLVESRVDAAARVWDGCMWIPVQNVGVQTFRLLEEAPAGMAPAWVVFHAGVAQVRLRPERGPIDGFLMALMLFLRSHAVDTDVLVMDLDDEPHMARSRRLASVPAPLLA